jgi:phosphomannomutase
MTKITCFKAYDLRGRVPEELNEDVAYRVGRAFAEFLTRETPGGGRKKFALGHDIRLTSQAISNAVARGIMDAGADVYDIGLCGTEEIYFATFHEHFDGGIAVTASHNPKNYNGMKFVREGSKPISGDTGLFEIRAMAEAGDFARPAKGNYHSIDTSAAYIKHLLGYVDVKKLKPLKIVAHAGNGGAGRVIDLLEKHLPFEFIKVQHEADGNFPNGVPNPLEEHNRAPSIEAIKKYQADLGVAWDGDFDRCFFFDENANFIEGYYVVGLLSEAFLQKHPGGKVVHDPRLVWNTIDIANQCGGTAIESKTGHAFIKERMRKEDAVYGGEMSAHHYFRDFAYCDSGMIPWLLVCELICASGKSLSQLVSERMAAYPCSGEINNIVANPKALLELVEKKYAAQALNVNHTDGLSMEFENWRFNLRMSNTEPVVRMNVETRADSALMERKRDELLAMVKPA